MLHRLARAFSIPPGDERRTFLLFFIYLLFFSGLRWADSASRTLFQLSWGDLLSVIFLFSAPLALIAGLTYSYFAGRLNNERLLFIIIGLMMAWLISVQALLLAGVGLGERGPTYLYFFLGTLVFADVMAIHLLNYTNEFYDTRAAKQALPFILSASIAGSVVAGFSAPLLNQLIGLKAMPLAWAACLLGMLGLVFVMRRNTPPELAHLNQQRQLQRKNTRMLQDLRADARLLGKMEILRWMAISTLVLVVLMKLLTIQSATIFNHLYVGNPTGLFNVYNVLDATFSLIGLAFSAVVFNRLIVRYGVGNISLVFPVLTAVIVFGINFLPELGLIVAALAYLDDRAFKKVFRNPIDAMFYNSVPVNIKGRARAFINSFTVPLGSLLAGLLGLAMASGGFITPLAGALLSLCLALFYMGVSWLVKNAYSRAMIRLVADDELAPFRAGYAEQEESDPLLVRRLSVRLNRGEDDDDTTIVLAEMLYDFQGRAALDRLVSLAEQRSGPVRAAVIQLVADWAEEPPVRQLCLRFLNDENERVRRAAAAALAAIPDASADAELVARFREAARQPDELMQASILPVLIEAGDSFSASIAGPLLSAWLSDKHSPSRRALGLKVLANTNSEQLIAQLTLYLTDPSPIVRVQAIDVICAFVSGTAWADENSAARQAGLDALAGVLSDEEVSVRLAVVNCLGTLNSVRHKPTQQFAAKALMTAMHDHRFRVRRAACEALLVFPHREMEHAYRSSDDQQRDAALYVLAHVGQRQVSGLLVRKRLTDRCEELARRWYSVQVYYEVLSAPSTPGTVLLGYLLREQARWLEANIFWLLSALHGDTATATVRRSLRSFDPRARANALESLEAISTPRLAELVTPIYTEADPVVWTKLARERLNVRVPSLWEAYYAVWPQLRPAHADLAATPEATPFDPQELLTAASMYVVTETLLSQGERVTMTRDQVQIALRETAQQTPLLRETATLALTKLEAWSSSASEFQPDAPGLWPGEGGKKLTMLTLIEKMVVLKHAQFFDEMLTTDLRSVAEVSEVLTFDPGQTIITEGEPSDGLHVIVSGRVAVQHRKRGEAERTLTNLATLGPREYFGEMSLFDEGPSSADVVAMIPTQTLVVRRAPLFALLERRPALVMDLFRVLSRRLRQANEQLVKKRQ